MENSILKITGSVDVKITPERCEISPYKLARLSIVKIFDQVKETCIEHGHNIFEPADGSDIISPQFIIFDLKPHNFDAYLLASVRLWKFKYGGS